MTIERENPWTTHSSELRYENPWISVTEHQVTNPGGGKGIYGVVHMKTVGTGIVAIDEDMHIWLVGQWRYTLDAYSWEIPEGGGDPERPPLEAAKRELLEETGLEAGSWEELLVMHTSNSVTDEVAHVFLARELRKVGPARLEETESDLVVERLPFADALEMVMRNQITDSMAVAGILKAAKVLGVWS